MAASSEYDIDFEELERLFIDDTTDEQFSFDEIEAISEPSLSGKDSFLSTNVSVSSLKLVLDRLADSQTNFVEQERAIASVLSKVDEVKFVEFVASVAGLFEQCFGLRSSKQNKHLRAIELERNFTERRSKTNPASKAWEDILLHAGVAKCVASDNVYQHILQHFWSTTGSVFKQGNTSRPAAQEAVDDIMEIDAVKDHAGWAIKRTRDIIKSSTEDKLRIKNQVVMILGAKLTNQWLWSYYQSLERTRKNKMGVSDLYQDEKLENFFCHCMLLWTICYVRANLLLRKRKW